MNSTALIPFLALAIWMFALYSENKFSFFYKGKDPVRIARNVSGFRRWLILKNRQLRYLGLGLMWVGLSLGTVLSDGRINALSSVAYALGIAGLATYVLSRLWPFLMK